MHALVLPALWVSWWQVACLKTGVDVCRVLVEETNRNLKWYGLS